MMPSCTLIFTIRTTVFTEDGGILAAENMCRFRKLQLIQLPFLEKIIETLMIDVSSRRHPNQWLFLVPLKGGIGSNFDPPEGKDYKWYISGIFPANWGMDYATDPTF